MGISFLKIAGIYLVVGVSMSLYMGIAQTFTLYPVYAHINLLVWASMALMGLIYVQFPAAGQTRLAVRDEAHERRRFPRGCGVRDEKKRVLDHWS
jgi:hypothetical protein